MTNPKIASLWGLADDFDDDLAKSMLEVLFDKVVLTHDALEKSVYNFDLETPEGVDRLLELLPIMDPAIINEVYQEVFPTYPVDTLAPRVARIELRGYLMDYLNGEFEDGSEEPNAGPPTGFSEDRMAEEPGEQAPEQAPAASQGPEAS